VSSCGRKAAGFWGPKFIGTRARQRRTILADDLGSCEEKHHFFLSLLY
jgi:hypothetical protein